MQAELATFISNKFFVANLLPKDDVEIMAYYLENILSLLGVLFPIMIISMFTGHVLESMIYLTAFFLGRTCAGGYHAKTHFRCYLLSLGTYLLFLLFINMWCQFGQPDVFVLVMVMSVNIMLHIFAPADSPNKRFTKKEKEYYKKKSIALLFIYNILYISFALDGLNVYEFSLLYGIFQLAVSVMMARLISSTNQYNCT